MTALRSVTATFQADSVDNQPLPPVTPRVSPDDFRQVFRSYASGVVVITADDDRGPAGLTVTSLASLSLEPAFVCFSIGTNVSAWPTIRRTKSVAVNFLGDDQHETAARFATSGIDRFAAPTRWSRLHSGHVVLDDSPTVLLADVIYRWPMGDHFMIVGHVRDADVRRPFAPLVYHAGAYGSVTSTRESAPR